MEGVRGKEEKESGCFRVENWGRADCIHSAWDFTSVSHQIDYLSFSASLGPPVAGLSLPLPVWPRRFIHTLRWLNETRLTLLETVCQFNFASETLDWFGLSSLARRPGLPALVSGEPRAGHGCPICMDVWPRAKRAATSARRVLVISVRALSLPPLPSPTPPLCSSTSFPTFSLIHLRG